MKDVLKLTAREAESMGIELEKEGRAEVPEQVRELPLHEQFAGAMTNDDVVEALTGEVSEESREDVIEAVSDVQEDAAELEGT